MAAAVAAAWVAWAVWTCNSLVAGMKLAAFVLSKESGLRSALFFGLLELEFSPNMAVSLREDFVLRKLYLSALLMSAPVSLWAQSLNAPTVKAGDTWTYKTTTEKGASGWSQIRDETTVSRVTASTIYYTVKASGSNQPERELFAGIDWSRARDVNGKEMVVNKPLSFPLTAGKTWELHYTEQQPNKAHRSEEWNNKYTVVGYETVEVPAGKFNALKIESEGHWTAEVEPTQTVVQGAQSSAAGVSMVTQTQKVTDRTASGRTYKAFWYVPEVRRWVKSVEEYYASNGVRNEKYTGELESFNLTQ
jgi:hypothetical protein